MADERLLITIEGKDGVSKTFVAVGKSAEAAGKTVEGAGKKGAAAMEELAEETKQTAASAEDLGRKYTAVGATIGSALATISKLGASYREQRLELISLESQYGDASDAIVDFTETIQDHYNQSNDAARDSALTFATLYRNYEMGEQQIIDLMQRTADISSARGRSMTEVSQMVQNALRGEAEYIEQIGVTLNDTYVASEYAARGLGNWNTLTDEAAKAQFRYILLMEQTVDTQGRAAEEADRAGGLMRRWINELQDAGQAAGGVAGPVGEMAAEFSQIAVGLPVVFTGLGKVAAMARNSAAAMSILSVATGPVGWAIAGITVGAIALTKIFGDSDDAMEANSQSAEKLAMSMASLDDIIKQTSLSGDFWLAGTFREWDKQAEDAIAGLESHIGDLWTGLDSMIQDGAVKNGATGQTIVNWIDDMFGREALEAQLGENPLGDYILGAIEAGNADLLAGPELAALEQISETLIKNMIPDAEDQARVADAMKPIWDLMTNPAVDQSLLASQYQQIWDSFDDHGSVERLVSDLEALENQTLQTVQASQLMAESDYLNFMGQMDLAEDIQQLELLRDSTLEVNASLTTGEQKAYAEAWDGIFEAIREGEVDGDRVIGQIRSLDYQLATGQITNVEYAQSIVDIYLGLGDYEAASLRAEQATIAQTRAVTAAQLAMRGYTDEQIALNLALGTFVAIEPDVTSAVERGITSGVGLTNTMRMIRNESAGLGESINAGITPAVDDLRLLEETLTGILDLIGAGDLRSKMNLAGVGSDASIAADGLMDASTALDTTYRVVVGNTNAIASQVDGIHSWAEELINVEGTYGEIDRLLQNGLITQQQYNDAQQAYNTIAAANVQIQDDVLAIQAQQAPLIASQTDAMADYVEQIRLMNDGTVEGATKQLEALAWMDDGLQQQAMNVSLFADQLDDLGPKGEEAFGQMVASIEATNPALFTMLETMGYVSNVVRDEDGKVISYDINIDGADGAMSDIERLTLSIDALIETLGGVPPEVDVEVNAEDNATGPIRTARTEAEDLDGTTSTINVVANDQASGVLQGLASQWGGTIATSFVDVITRRYEQGTPGKASGGVVGYAGGGVIVELAEAGSEIVHFAAGGTAYVGQRGVYELSPGDFVQPHNAVSNSYGGDTVFNITVNGADAAYIESVFTSQIVPNIIHGIFTNRAGQGVM